MYEIELKAHVHDRKSATETINSFANYCGTTAKTDTYYHLTASAPEAAIPSNPGTQTGTPSETPASSRTSAVPASSLAPNIPATPARITCRIRHETHTDPRGGTVTTDYLTYKSKERRTGSDGSAYEVNQEHETTLSDPGALQKLLLDSGWTLAYTKTKDVTEWKYDTPYGTAHLELCNVPPLGDFLEIEIVTENCNNEKVINDTLKELILKAGLSLSDIEKKYYSELLKEAGVVNV